MMVCKFREKCKNVCQLLVEEAEKRKGLKESVKEEKQESDSGEDYQDKRA